jgi:flagellar hook-length control protein FliK
MPSVNVFSLAKLVADIAGRKAEDGNRTKDGEASVKGEFSAMVREGGVEAGKSEEAARRRLDRRAGDADWHARRAEARAKAEAVASRSRARRDETPENEPRKDEARAERMAPEPRGRGKDKDARTDMANSGEAPMPAREPVVAKKPEQPQPKDARTNTVTCGEDGTTTDTVTCGDEGKSTTDTVVCGDDGAVKTDTVTSGEEATKAEAGADTVTTDTVTCGAGGEALTAEMMKAATVAAAASAGTASSGAAIAGGVAVAAGATGDTGESLPLAGGTVGAVTAAGATVAKGIVQEATTIASDAVETASTVSAEAKLEAAINLANGGKSGNNGAAGGETAEAKIAEIKLVEARAGETKSGDARLSDLKAALEANTATSIKGADINPTRMSRFADLLEGFNPSNAAHRPADILAGLDRSVQASALNQRVEITRPTPLQMLPIEIGMQAVRGVTNFQIRLDPAELGRVDVKLQIRDSGEISATLVVDRVETLNLLRRDASVLANAFEQAGLKQGSDGLSFSLRGDNPNGGQGREDGNGSNGQPEEAQPKAGAEIAMRRAYVSNSSLDLMI